MRILLAEGSGRGFLNQYSHALALGLHEAGERVRLVTGRRDELADWVVPFEKDACLADGLAGWLCLCGQVKRFNPDLVHLQWIDHPLAALVFLRWAHYRGVRVIYTPHNILPHERRWLSLPFFREIYRSLDRVVVRDLHLGWALEELLDTPQERLAYLPGSPNPLALPDFPSSFSPELAGRQPGELRILFFGHGSGRKGLGEFLEVMAGCEWPEQLHLVVAGEGVLAGVNGDLLGRARARVRISVLDRYLRPSEVSALFSQGELLVMPYRKQCKSPLTDLAAAFGVPVLRSDRVQGVGFQDGEHGLTYPHDQQGQLTKILQDLVMYPGVLEILHRGLAGKTAVSDAICKLADGHRVMYRELQASFNPLPLESGMVGNTVGGGL